MAALAPEIATLRHAFQDAPECGDVCFHQQQQDRLLLCVVDGLGHGAGAEQAALSAVRYVERHTDQPLDQLFRGCDSAIRSTRGAAMGLALWELGQGRLTFGGVGNVRGLVVGEDTHRLRSTPGIVGAGYDTIHFSQLELGPQSLLMLYTDGLPTELALDSAASRLFRIDLEELAKEVMQRWYRGNDDGAILLCRSVA